MNKKKLAEMWKVVEVPVYVMIGWSILTVVLPLTDWLGMSNMSAAGWIMTFAVFGVIGHNIRKEKIGTVAKHGALAGAVIGFAGAVISLIAFNVVPDRFASQIAQAASKPGVTEDMVTKFMAIGMYINLIIGPAITAGMGALISLATAWICKKTE